jgi:hypothetical protein
VNLGSTQRKTILTKLGVPVNNKKESKEEEDNKKATMSTISLTA